MPTRRPKTLIAVLAALTLLSVPALAPAPAAAQDDETWCFRIVNGSVQFVNECEASGSGEVIVVVGKAPEPNRPPSGPGFDRSAGDDSDSRGLPGSRGGGGHIAPAPTKPKRKVPLRCQKHWETLLMFNLEERKISRGEVGFLEFFFKRYVKTSEFEAAKKAWIRAECGPVPTW